MQLRDYQGNVMSQVDLQWSAGAKNVLVVSPTGSGKTVMFGHALAREPGASVAIAHRQELVSQISMSLARYGLRHRIIGPDSVARNCVSLHVAELGRHFIDPGARCAVAGVQTLIRRDPGSDPWFRQVQLLVQDEAHHVLADNSWGKGCAMFPNARGLFVTATPGRADGKGLGRKSDGLVDVMVVGPGMRDLINRKYLTDYRIFAPRTTDLDLSNVPTSASGDFSPVPLRKAVHKSHIVGDVVAHYKRLAMGKLGVTFAVDVESAGELVRAYREAGVPAELVTAETPDLLRAQILRRFRNREILQLVNVDLFGEGFDLPAIEVVSMARPTQSFALYVQQFGRALRLLAGKEWAIILDHVGNVKRHGLPDAPRKHSLERREKRSGSNGPSDTIPMTVCLGCTAAYEAFHRACPYCAAVRVPVGRSSPQQVDGVLEEMDPVVLARKRGEVAAKDAAVAERHPDARIRGHHHKLAGERNQAQAKLRARMMLWGGMKSAEGHTDAEGQALFFFRYGMSIVDAWLLDTAEAQRLTGYLETDLTEGNVCLNA